MLVIPWVFCPQPMIGFEASKNLAVMTLAWDRGLMGDLPLESQEAWDTLPLYSELLLQVAWGEQKLNILIDAGNFWICDVFSMWEILDVQRELVLSILTFFLKGTHVQHNASPRVIYKGMTTPFCYWSIWTTSLIFRIPLCLFVAMEIKSRPLSAK